MPGCELGIIFTIDGYAFHEIKSFKNLESYLENLYKKGELDKLAQKIDEEGGAIFKQVEDDIEQDNDYIISNFQSIFLRYQEFIGFWTVTTLIGNQMSPLAKKMNYVETEADLFEKVHPHLRESWIEEEVSDMRKIAEKFIEKYGEGKIGEIEKLADEDKTIKEDINSYIRKYAWSKISKWIGDPIDQTHAHKRLVEEVNNVINKNYIDKSYTNDKHADGLVQIAVNSAYYRAQATMLEMKMALRMKSIFAAIAEKNDLEYNDILLLTPHELIEVFSNSQNKISDVPSILERRGAFFISLDKTGKEIVFTPKDNEYSLIYELYVNDQKNNNTKELKGIGASKGKVTATVRVIESAKEFDTFKDGEVLVAVETSPTFVPLMRMASAILTGRGGITSHAAIVSRELNKPCIIAIKDVTKILKTGDMVEIDANVGVVRILEK